MHQQLQWIILAAAAALAACGNDTNHEQYGSLDVTASAPNTGKDIATADGWVVKYDKFLVSIASVTVSQSDTEVVTASATAQIIDAVAPAPTTLLGETVRRAHGWDTFTFLISPAVDTPDAPITLAATVKDADRDIMTKAGLSIYLEGKATKGAVAKTMKWGFTTDTTFTSCEGELDGARVLGVLIPPNGGDAVDLALRGEVLFSDDLGAPGAALRFEAIARADADGNGEVTTDELMATPLDVARKSGPYGIGDKPGVADLGGFVSALTRDLLASYRAKGTCVASPTASATGTPAAPY